MSHNNKMLAELRPPVNEIASIRRIRGRPSPSNPFELLYEVEPEWAQLILHAWILETSLTRLRPSSR